jgi:hypothetical protein
MRISKVWSLYVIWLEIGDEGEEGGLIVGSGGEMSEGSIGWVFGEVR